MYDTEFIDAMTNSPKGAGHDKDIDREKFLAEFKKWPKYLRLVGSARYSHQRYIGDVDLVSTRPLQSVVTWLESRYRMISRNRSGPRILSVTIELQGIPAEVNVWYAARGELPTMLLAYGYPRQFNIAIRKKLKEKGMRLSQYGLFKGREKQPITNVRQIFKEAGLEYRTPEAEGRKHNL